MMIIHKIYRNKMKDFICLSHHYFQVTQMDTNAKVRVKLLMKMKSKKTKDNNLEVLDNKEGNY